MKIHHPTQPGYTRFMRLAFAVGLMFIVMAGPALADWEHRRHAWLFSRNGVVFKSCPGCQRRSLCGV
jgi:hypothetical protein